MYGTTIYGFFTVSSVTMIIKSDSQSEIALRDAVALLFVCLSPTRSTGGDLGLSLRAALVTSDNGRGKCYYY